MHDAIRVKYPAVNRARMAWNVYSKKMSFCTYKAILDRLLTSDRLATWGILVDRMCKLCNEEQVSHEYLFFTCSYNKYLLSFILLKIDITVSRDISILNMCDYLSQKPKFSSLRANFAYMTLVTFIYHIWAERNRRVFNDKRINKIHRARLLEKEIVCQASRLSSRIQISAEDMLFMGRWKIEIDNGFGGYCIVCVLSLF